MAVRKILGRFFRQIPAPDVFVQGYVIRFFEGLLGAMQNIDLLYNEIAIVVAGPAPGYQVPLFCVVNDAYGLDLALRFLFFEVGVFDVEDRLVRYGALDIRQVLDGPLAPDGIDDTNTVAELGGRLLFAGMKHVADLFQRTLRIPHHRDVCEPVGERRQQYQCIGLVGREAHRRKKITVDNEVAFVILERHRNADLIQRPYVAIDGPDADAEAI